MNGYTDRQNEQYFDPIVSFENSGEVFIDVGGFDGATSLEFSRLCKEYEHIHIFEPDKKNIAMIQKNLGSVRDVTLHKIGLSDVKQTLSFISHGSDSRIAESGENSIEVGPLDQAVAGAISFIKIDIEGGEINAIKGAAEKIRNYSPKMAICVYHKADDYWRIPETVLDINPNYTIDIRHYTEGITETVMYFIPKK